MKLSISEVLKTYESARKLLEKAQEEIFDAGAALELINPEMRKQNRYAAIRFRIDEEIKIVKELEQNTRVLGEHNAFDK